MKPVSHVSHIFPERKLRRKAVFIFITMCSQGFLSPLASQAISNAPLALEREVVLGRTSAVMSACVGKTGKIYVADHERFEIQEYTATGKYVRSLGGRGNGPGKFHHAPMAVAVDDRGFVYAAQYGKIMVWNQRGNLEKEIPFQGIPRKIDAGKNWLVVAGKFDHTQDESEATLHIYQNFLLKKRLFPHVHMNGENWSDGSLMGMDVQAGSIYAIQPLQYEVKVFDVDGDETRSFGNDSFYVRAPRFDGPPPRESFETLQWMQSWTPPMALFCMTDSVLVVQSMMGKEENFHYALDIFDAQGQPIALHVPWSGGFPVSRDKKGKSLYCWETREEKGGKRIHFLKVFKWTGIPGAAQ